MGVPVLKKFGRYFILDALSKGGMAEVFRGRRLGASTAHQIIALKQIGESFAKDESFIKMFNDEMNIMMGLNHPNIVQLYDCGIEAGKPFIAMEYVFGPNFRDFIIGMISKEMPPQVPFAAYVGEQAAAGLHYAHTFRDKLSGRSLKIVHRDISPRNLVISYDGQVKIIDFGVAKTNINTEHTKTGVIKGNLAYLSPELVSGEDPDARSDVFSLGVVLWELLVNRRFFQTEGLSEFAILKQIDGVDKILKAPSSYKPGIPRELDDIILKAMQKDREDRFPTAEAFQLALRRFLQANYPDFTSKSAKTIVDSLFKEQRRSERTHLRALNEQAIEILKHLPEEGSATNPSLPPPPPSGLSSKASPLARSGTSGTGVGVPMTGTAQVTSPPSAMKFLSKLSWQRAILFGILSLTGIFTLWKTERTFRSISSVVGSGPDALGIPAQSVIAWFQADSLNQLKNGEPVSYWEEEGPNKNSFSQNELGARPKYATKGVNGIAAVEFDGSSSWLVANTLAKYVREKDTLTITVVGRSTSGVTQYFVSCHDSDKNSDVVRVGFTNLNRLQLGTTGNKYLDVKLDTPGDDAGVYTTVIGTDTIKIYVNGKLLHKFGGTQVSLSKAEYCSIGQEYDLGKPSDYFKGFISEVVVFDHALTSEEQTVVDRLLMKKYRIDKR